MHHVTTLSQQRFNEIHESNRRVIDDLNLKFPILDADDPQSLYPKLHSLSLGDLEHETSSIRTALALTATYPSLMKIASERLGRLESEISRRLRQHVTDKASPERKGVV